LKATGICWIGRKIPKKQTTADKVFQEEKSPCKWGGNNLAKGEGRKDGGERGNVEKRTPLNGKCCYCSTMQRVSSSHKSLLGRGKKTALGVSRKTI